MGAFFQMSVIKSFSVGNGDTFYIKHENDSFTVIDCCLDECNCEDIIDEIACESKEKPVFRFISTHPDDTHIKGLTKLDDRIGIINFYCVENDAVKNKYTEDFRRYCKLRDSKKHYYLYKDCSRKWLNNEDDRCGSAGISILWPDISNDDYINALENANKGKSLNNICPIIKYSMKNGITALWMGDMETDYIEKIKDCVEFSQIDILFVPHNSRRNGRIPNDVLSSLSPKIIVVGEASSEALECYSDYNIITQNSAGDITFECLEEKVKIFVGNPDYCVDFLTDEKSNNLDLGNYIGTLNLF